MFSCVLWLYKIGFSSRTCIRFSSWVPTEILYGFIFSPIRARCLTCFVLILFYYATNLWLEFNTVNLSIMQSSLHVSPYLRAPCIFLSVLLSNVLNLCSFTAWLLFKLWTALGYFEVILFEWHSYIIQIFSSLRPTETFLHHRRRCWRFCFINTGQLQQSVGWRT